MKPGLVGVTSAVALLIAACGGSGGQPAASAPSATQAVQNGSGGVRIVLTLEGGPHDGDYSLTHTNPCRFDNPSDGDWALTATFPSATTGPSIVDLVLNNDSGFVDAWFGNDHFHAPNPEFTVDDRGETATLTASGQMSGPQGGASFPAQITVECDRVARY